MPSAMNTAKLAASLSISSKLAATIYETFVDYAAATQRFTFAMVMADLGLELHTAALILSHETTIGNLTTDTSGNATVYVVA